MSLLSAFKKIGSVSLGVTSLPWLADTVARKIPGYDAVRNVVMTPQMKAAADAMHNLGNLKLAGGVTKAIDLGKASAKAQVAAGGVGTSPNLQAGKVAADLVLSTAKAAKTDPRAASFLKVMKTVEAAKRGNPQAKVAVKKYVKSQVATVLREGARADAPPEVKQAARLAGAVIKATAARKRASRQFGVDRRTARVVRVA